MKTLFRLGFISLLMSNTLAAVPPTPTWYTDLNGGYGAVHKSYAGKSWLTKAGWSIASGYRFLRNMAAEVCFTHYPNVDVNINGVSAKDTHYSYDIAAKGILPIFCCSGFELFGKLGAGKLNSSTKGSGIHSNHYVRSYYFAAGASYYFLPTFSLNVQAARATGDSQTGSFNLYTIGLSSLFGN